MACSVPVNSKHKTTLQADAGSLVRLNPVSVVPFAKKRFQIGPSMCLEAQEN